MFTFIQNLLNLLRHFRPYMLLVLAAFHCGASMLLPLAQVSMARSRASVRLRRTTEQEETFRLSKTVFLQGRSGQREWWHDGQLYDLKHIQVKGDSVCITAVADVYEQKLIAGFQHLFGVENGAKPGTNSLLRLLVQFLFQPFLSAAAAWSLLTPPAVRFFPPVHFFQTRYLSGFFRIFSPPPESGSGQ